MLDSMHNKIPLIQSCDINCSSPDGLTSSAALLNALNSPLYSF